MLDKAISGRCSSTTYTPIKFTKSLLSQILGWRKEYGGLKVDQARRLKALEQENAKLKRLVPE